jgi:DNA polymerase-3 subunit beta
MKIKIQKEDIAGAVADVARFADRRSATLPVLSGILIVAGDDGIRLRATNLETGIDRAIEGEVGEAGIVAVPAQVLREITSSFSGSGSVTLEQSGDTLKVSAGSGKSVIKTLSADDFPVLPFPESPKASFSIAGAALKSLIGAVAGCASSSTIRPELASVLLKAESGTLKAVATDSFRLAEKSVTPGGSIEPFSILIPAKNAADIAQTIPDGEVSVALDDHQCAFSWPQGMLTTRLVAGTYPDYAAIIPKSFAAEATLLRKDFEAALRRATVFSDSFQKVRLSLDPSEKKVSFAAQNNDVGTADESVSGTVSGDAVELSFNHRYLSAPLPLIAAESVTLSASGIGRPLVIRGAGDASYLYLVMPMNQ